MKTGKVEDEKTGNGELDEIKQYIKNLEKTVADLQKQNLPIAVTPQETTGSIIKDVVKAIEETKFDQKGYYKPEQIDPDDVLPEPIQFSSYGLMYLVLDDKKNGRPVLPPGTTEPGQKKFLFKPSGRVKRWRQVGEKSEMYYQNFCTISVGSKRDAEWLKSHSRFNIEFFTNTNKALSTDAHRSQVAAQIMLNLERCEQSEILRMAKELGIEIGGELSTIRAEVAFKTANMAVMSMEQEQIGKAKETMEKTLMSGQG